MQMYVTIKLVFLISFYLVVWLMLTNYHFDRYDLKFYFMKIFWRSKGQNYSLALKKCVGNDMQCNTCEVKWEAQNKLSTSSNSKVELHCPNQIQIATPPRKESFWQTNSKPLHSCEDFRPKPRNFMWYCLFIRLQYIFLNDQRIQFLVDTK